MTRTRFPPKIPVPKLRKKETNMTARTRTWSSSHFYSRYLTLTKGLNMCDSQVIRLTTPTLPSLLTILKDFKGNIVSETAQTAGTSIILCVCSFLERSSDPSMKSTCAEPQTLLVLTTDVISEGSGEHVRLHNLVRVSLTNEV